MRFQKTRRTIAARLLLLKPSYRTMLLAVRVKLGELLALGPLAEMPAEQQYSLQDFVANQQDYQK